MLRVTLYVAPRCPLCSTARHVILDFAREHPLELEEVDISRDGDLWEKHQYDVPVLVVGGRQVARHHVSQRRLSRLYSDHLAGEKPRELVVGGNIWDSAAGYSSAV